MADNYDFIMNNQPKRSGPAFLQSKTSRYAALAGFIVVILILVIAAFNIISGSGGPTAASYVPVYARQEELIRILEERDDLNDAAKKRKYTTLYISLLSDSQRSTDYFAEFGYKVLPEETVQYTYKDFDDDIETARTASRFDSEYNDYVDTALSDYISEILKIQPTEAQKPLLEQAAATISAYRDPVAEPTE